MRRTARKPAGHVCQCPEGVLRGPALHGSAARALVLRGPALCGLRSCAGSGRHGPRAARAGYGWLARRSPVWKLWIARWKRACSGGQHSRRCGHFVDTERILKLVPANPCATGVPGSRNTSLPETGTTPGATPERRKNRETGTSRGHPVPVAGRLTNRPPGDQRASGQRPGQAPASHTCRGLAYFSACLFLGARPISGFGLFPGPAHPQA
jgi:hypothetical protein